MTQLDIQPCPEEHLGMDLVLGKVMKRSCEGEACGT
jgi:hypothetical protein